MSGPSWVPKTVDGRVSTEGYARFCPPCASEEVFFCDNHERAVEIATGSGDASYEYDDYWFGRLDDKYYLFNTSGCSCPSPEETWSLVLSGTETELRDHIVAAATEYKSRHASSAGIWVYEGDGLFPLIKSLITCGWLQFDMPDEGKKTDW